MRTFVFKILKYLSYLAIGQCIIVYTYLSILKINEIPPYILTTSSVHKESSIYILGNSHPECAINDKLLPSKYINVSQSGEPLFYSVIKARKLLDAKNQIDTIVIGFTNNSLNTVKWAVDNDRLMENYSNNFAKMNRNEHLFLMGNNPLKVIKTFFSLSPSKIYNSAKIITGGYRKLKRKSARPYIKTSIHYKNSDQKTIKSSELVGFKNLLILIKNNPNSFFIITRMPLHRTYKGLYNEIQFQKCVNKIKLLKNCRFIDFLTCPLEDKCYSDTEHLNYFGAKVFSPIFLECISNPTSKSNQHHQNSN